MVTGLLMATAAMLWFTQIGVHTSYVLHVLPGEIVMSLGMGLVFVPLSSNALIGVEKHDAGVASAMVNTTQQVGGSLGTALLNTIAATAATGFVAAHGSGQSVQMQSVVHGYTTAFRFGAALLVIAAVSTASLLRTSKEGLPEGEGVLIPA